MWHTIGGMKKPDKQLTKALKDLDNVVQFCERHQLPLRTVMRIRAGGVPNPMTAHAIRHALALEVGRKVAA